MWREDKFVKGDAIEPTKFPAGLEYEAAGIVDAVGKDVTGFAVGDAVSCIPIGLMNQYPTYGEVILYPDFAVVKHPASLSFAEAASIWMMFITAYGALIADAEVTKGDFVIIPAASSSTGLSGASLAMYVFSLPRNASHRCNNSEPRNYLSLAYSLLAAMRIGMSASAFFQTVRKSWYVARALR